MRKFHVCQIDSNIYARMDGLTCSPCEWLARFNGYVRVFGIHEHRESRIIFSSIQNYLTRAWACATNIIRTRDRGGIPFVRENFERVLLRIFFAIIKQLCEPHRRQLQLHLEQQRTLNWIDWKEDFNCIDSFYSNCIIRIGKCNNN